MAKEKACKICNMIYEGDRCPNCNSKETTDNIKGKIIILNPEKSEIGGKLKIKNKGIFAIKTR
ncbi:MAG: transcription elongation factor subunit Spt4 [archaeon]|nr:transcription elongation factor subunit Spt4 [archaeon]